MDENIKAAIELLRENDYVVIKKTQSMKDDMDACAEMSSKGQNMDCFSCACNICVMYKGY